MKSITIKILIITISILLISFTSINKEKFTGYNKLKDCEINIPLYYASKKQGELQKSAIKYRGIEIVLVTNLKKEKTSYEYYYLVEYESSNGTSAYLVNAQEYKSKSSKQTVLFLNYKPKKHTFYLAKCFKEKLNSDEGLAKNLKK